MSFLSRFISGLTGNVKTVGEPNRAVFSSNRTQGFGDKTNDAFAHTKINKYNFGSLVYPKELEQNAGYGHYMLFYIYRSYQSKYGRKPQGSPNQINNVGISQQSTNTKLFNANTMANSTSFKRFVGYKQTSDAIALYMPADLKFQYQVQNRNNVETEFAGQFAKGGAEAINRLRSNDETSFSDILGEIGGMASASAKTLIVEKLLKQGSASFASLIGAGDVLATVNLARNKALNPHLEAVFDKVDFRSFNYTFRFTPRSEDEVRTVHEIIHKFKFHMLPERIDNGHFLAFPSEFEIHFMYKGAENTWIPFISHCVLNSVDVDYGGDQYQTFRPIPQPKGDGSDAPPPSTITMTLNFTEGEIMTKEMIDKGF